MWPSEAEKLRFFVSYSSLEKDIAGALKRTLEEFGVDVFVAHDDITPSDEWVKAILENLTNTHVFIVLLSDNFKKSDWTDQETGIAFVLKRYIIPIKIQVDPYGFIRHIHALKTGEINDLEISKIRNEILDIIVGIAEDKYDIYKINFKELLCDSIIIKFIESDTFDSARANYHNLAIYADSFSKVQLNALFYWSIKNSQIYDNFKTCPDIKWLFEKNEDVIEQDIRDEFVSFIKNHPR